MSKFNLTVRADVYVPFMYSISVECNGTPSFFFQYMKSMEFIT